MATKTRYFLGLTFLLFTILPPSNSLLSTPYTKAISDLKDTIVKGLGFPSEDMKISGFDLRDALVGHSVAYEFDLQIENNVIPFKLLEDVDKWDFVVLPIFPLEGGGDKNGLVDKTKSDNSMPVLAPFQLAGPMELWIQDAKHMRISLPHDVDAGVLKKVMLADGAVVTVKGARSVSLRHPVDLPLPLNLTDGGFASGFLTLAEQLRHASREKNSPLLSLRIVGPTSLTTPTSSSPSANNRLKLKRLAPGLIELSPPSNTGGALSPIELNKEATALLTPNKFTTMWPIASINYSNKNLLGFQKLLASVLGSKANNKGSVKLVKADVSAQTYLKIGFGVEKKLREGDIDMDTFPAWRTKPETVNMHFEVLAKVEGEKIVAERVVQINPFIAEDTVAPNVLTRNVTMSTIDVIYPPPNAFAFHHLYSFCDQAHWPEGNNLIRCCLLNKIVAFYIVGAAMSATVVHLFMLVGRIISGLGVGFGNVGVPLFLFEAAQVQQREAVNIMFQLFIAIGILIVNLVNYVTSKLQYPFGCRVSLGVAIISALLLLLGGIFITYKRSSLIEHDKESTTSQALEKFRGVEDFEVEFNKMKITTEIANQVKKPTSTEAFPRTRIRFGFGKFRNFKTKFDGFENQNSF
ncbi:hypothetical protein ACFE04_011911 [Oxalis oulophora]